MQKFLSRGFFLIPRFAGRLVGCWPQAKRSRLTAIRFWINCFLVAIGACCENLYGFVYYSDLQNALEAFCPGITKAVCFFKMYLFFSFSESWFSTIQRLKSMLDENSKNQEKKEMIEKLTAFGNGLSFLLLFSGSSTNVFFNVSPLITGAYGVWLGKEFPYELPFHIIIPELFKCMPVYPFTYLALTLSGFMTVFTFSFVDGFFVCACMYMSAMFRMLQNDIRKLFNELRTLEHATVSQNAIFRLQLSAIVVRHNEIIDLCSDFTAQFTVIILMHFLSAAMVLCVSILNLMLNFGSISVLIYLFYSIAALTQLFLYCIGGNYVSESSLEVASALYEIEWYKCDVSTKKMILMMLRRSQKAKTIAVPFFTPSLLAFSSIRYIVSKANFLKKLFYSKKHKR